MMREALIQYVADAYGVEAEYPFPRDDVSCVFRRGDNRKWFGLAMRVPRRTLGLPGEDRVDIVNVKCDPLLIGSLRARPGFLPAYHMNKENWITILLDGSVPQEDIEALVEMSHALTGRRGKG